jgi:glycosyltransferase involved in cell wall biosynthesis
MRAENYPRISVLLPINRDDGFFEEALESVLKQSYDNFEIIILANNCSDELWEEILKINDPKVISQRIEMGGLALALNVGLLLARGQYIARMDADDICMPNRFKSQIEFMDENKNIDILGGKVKLINQSGVEINEEIAFYDSHDQIISVLPYRNPMVHPTIFIRKKMLLENGGYRFGFTGEDYELWVRLMLSNKKFHNLNEHVLYYRRHDLQMTGEGKDYLIFCDVSSMLFMYFLKTKKLKFFIGSIAKFPLFRRILKLKNMKVRYAG